jgi:O-antigen/teichoic acid export membrane protein
VVKLNLFSNFIGQAWSALMGFAFIPLYIKYMGIESYGLIGIFALLTAWLGLLDIGMTPTLNREMGRYIGGIHTSKTIWDLLRSIEIIAFVISVLLGVSIYFGSNFLASTWLKVENIPLNNVVEAFTIMGIVTSLRFFESIYRSSILGLQKQVVFNIANSVIATIRGFGSLAVLIWVSPTISAFFIWQCIVSVISVITLRVITYKLLPKINFTPKFSFSVLKNVKTFAIGMILNMLLALLLTEVDKIILSKLLPLSEFGYYTLASIIATSLTILISPITQALFPKLSELVAKRDEVSLIKTFHQGSQLVSVLIGSAAMVLFFHSNLFLQIWIKDPITTIKSYKLLSFLVLGSLLNGIMWIPYYTQLAHGWTSLAAKINTVAVIVIIPAIYIVVPKYGAEGAALIWCILNAAYILIGMQFMFQKILINEKSKWFLNDVIFPISSALIISLSFKLLIVYPENYLSKIILLFIISAMTLFVSASSSKFIRFEMHKFFKLKSNIN